MEPTNPDTFDIEQQPFPFAYGTFGQTNKSVASTQFSVGSVISSTNIPAGGENLGIYNSGSALNPLNPLNSCSNILLSPSYSRRSRSALAGVGNKRNSMTSQPERYENIQATSIEKYTISFLTLICIVLLANMAQMIVLYSSYRESNRKYILMYYIFPFICFIMLKINDINLCNQIGKLFDAGYQSVPIILNKYRQIIHLLTFVGFPFLWIMYSIIMSHWIQNIQINETNNFSDYITDTIIHSVSITIWIILQFIQFILSIVCLLYCIQHNINQQLPDQNGNKSKNYRKFSLSISNPFNTNNNQTTIVTRNNVNYIKKIQSLEKNLSVYQTELIKCKQENMINNSQLNNDYNDELQSRNQDYRILISERDLLKSEVENKKSALSAKKNQCKQQMQSIKTLQQMREENISSINNLKKKLFETKKELQKTQILLQMERQNVQKAQQYFENFT